MCQSSWSLGKDSMVVKLVGFRFYSDQSTETSLPVQHFFVISFELNFFFPGCRPHSASSLLLHLVTNLLPRRDSSKSLLRQKHILPLLKDIIVSSETKTTTLASCYSSLSLEICSHFKEPSCTRPCFLGSVKQQKRWNPTTADGKIHKYPLSSAPLVRAQLGVI